jgi:prophage maintenance system killer protein
VRRWNKRTGLNAVLVFLELNGWSVDDPDGILYEAMVGLACGTQTRSGLAEVFVELSVRVDD